jgi:hypothetical protein
MRKLMPLMSAAIAVGGLVSSLQAQQIVIDNPAVITDGFIYQSIPTVSASQLAGFNTGMDGSLGVGITGGATPRSITSLIRFDLASLAGLPPEATATLRLTNIGTSFIVPPASGVTDPTASQPITIGVRKVTSPCSFNSVSFVPGTGSLGGPAQTNAGQPTYDSLGPVDTETVSSIGQVVELDVTSIVFSWVLGSFNNNANNFGFSLVQTSSPTAIPQAGWAVANFGSSRNTLASARPQLILNIPEPTTLFAVAATSLVLLRRKGR